MKLEYIILELQSLKRELYYKKIVLKNYCIKKHISYTSTSRILKRGIDFMTLRSAYKILGLTPERNIPQVLLDLNIKALLAIKSSFEKGLI